MTFGELKKFVTEALGEDVLTIDKVISGVRSGFGDMIHRGYREFKYILAKKLNADESEFEKLTKIRKYSNAVENFKTFPYEMANSVYPDDCLEILYVKLFFEDRSVVATKLALNNSAIQSENRNGYFRTNFKELDYENTPACVYYKKGDELFFEWDNNFLHGELLQIEIGYYKNLPYINENLLRKMAGVSLKESLDIEDLDIPMPNDYCNILVNYMIFYTALAEGWDQEQVTVLKNEYKYSMEDMLARKNKEDQYDETTTIIKIDGRF